MQHFIELSVINEILFFKKTRDKKRETCKETTDGKNAINTREKNEE